MTMITRTTRRHSSGYRKARVREAQQLPLGWRYLTKVDIQQLKAAVKELLLDRPDIATLEACLLLWSSLVTGRHPKDLLNLKFRMLRRSERLVDETFGLVVHDAKWGWWLPVGAPTGQRNANDLMHPTVKGLYLPTTKTVTALINQCVARRRQATGGRFMKSAVPERIFTGGNELVTRVVGILAGRHSLGPSRARKATTTPEAIARWLPAELIGAAGGDVVLAAVTTGRISKQAGTPIHYGAVRHDRLIKRYTAAISPIDEMAHNALRSDLDAIRRDIAAQNGLDDEQRANAEVKRDAAVAAEQSVAARLATLNRANHWEQRSTDRPRHKRDRHHCRLSEQTISPLTAASQRAFDVIAISAPQ